VEGVTTSPRQRAWGSRPRQRQKGLKKCEEGRGGKKDGCRDLRYGAIQEMSLTGKEKRAWEKEKGAFQEDKDDHEGPLVAPKAACAAWRGESYQFKTEEKGTSFFRKVLRQQGKGGPRRSKNKDDEQRSPSDCFLEGTPCRRRRAIGRGERAM